MTVSSQTTETIIASSGAGQTAFLFDFPLVNKDQILVFKDDVIESPSLYVVNYIIGSQGGQIDYSASPTTGSKITITRNTDVTQILAYPVGGPFPSRSHEGALDKITMILLEMSDFLIAQITIITNTIIVDGTVENSTLRWNDTGETWDEFLVYLFPATDGNADEVLITDGAGQLSFVPLVDGAQLGCKDQVISSVSGVLSIDFALGDSVFVAMTEDITSTVITGLPSGRLASIEIEIDQDDPVRTWVWPANTTWIAGTEPDLSVVDGKYLIRLRTRDQGSSFMGTFGEDFS